MAANEGQIRRTGTSNTVRRLDPLPVQVRKRFTEGAGLRELHLTNSGDERQQLHRIHGKSVANEYGTTNPIRMVRRKSRSDDSSRGMTEHCDPLDL